MRFVSKSTNLNVILRPSLPGNPMLGTSSTPGLSVRFMDGIADIKDQEMIDLMLRHPGFNQDFISVDEGERDPYAFNRSDSEPDHIITEMRYGMPERRITPKAKNQLPPELMKMVQEYATEMVKELLPQAVEATLRARATEESVTEPIEAPATKQDAPKAENEIKTDAATKKSTPKVGTKEA